MQKRAKREWVTLASVVAIILLSFVVALFSSTKFDTRSQADFVYPTPACTACSWDQGSCSSGWFGSYCTATSSNVADTCRQKCFEPGKRRTCTTNSLYTQTCERVTAGCEKYAWTACPRYVVKTLEAPSVNKSCATKCGEIGATCESIGWDSKAKNGSILKSPISGSDPKCREDTLQYGCGEPVRNNGAYCTLNGSRKNLNFTNCLCKLP
jgi:hypothetical protein